MDGRIHFDVAGQLYAIDASCLENGNPSRLVQMYKSRASLSDSGCIRVDRPVESFSAILAMYQTGELHIPMTSCPEAFLNELDYWDISADMISSCCYNRLQSYLDDQETLLQFKKKLSRDQSSWKKAEYGPLSRKGNFRSKIWDIVEYTKPSAVGRVYFVWSLMMVMLSICVLAYSTEPSLQRNMTNCERLEYMTYSGMEEYHLVIEQFEKYCDDEKLPYEFRTFGDSNFSSHMNDYSDDWYYFWSFFNYLYNDDYYYSNSTTNAVRTTTYIHERVKLSTNSPDEIIESTPRLDSTNPYENDHKEDSKTTTSLYSTNSFIFTAVGYTTMGLNNTRKVQDYQKVGTSTDANFRNGYESTIDYENELLNDSRRLSNSSTYENITVHANISGDSKLKNNSLQPNDTVLENDLYPGSGKSTEEAPKGTFLKIPNMKIRIIQLVILEAITICFFAVDILLRMTSCPSIRRYFLSVINIADALALIGTVAHMFLLFIYKGERYRHGWIHMLQYAQLLRSLRLFRLVSCVRAGRVLAYSAYKNIRDLSVLILFIIAGMCVFSSCLYIVEDTNTIRSIPDGWYWAVITMTTVGYGDIKPSTGYGKVIACLAAITGIILLALAVPIFANEFLMLYKFVDSEHAVSKFLQQKRKAKTLKRSKTASIYNPNNEKT